MDKLGSSILSTFNDIKEATSFIPFINNENIQNSSFDLIRTSPTSIEGYLQSGQEFEQWNNFLSALMIYNQGLISIPPPSPTLSSSSSSTSSSARISTEQYFQLEKAKRVALNKYMRKSRKGIFEWSSLPNEVVSLVFGYMGIIDLFMCTSVCTEWFEFIINWSTFWDTLLPKMPHMNKPDIESIMRRQTSVFCINGPVDLDALHGMLFCLACPSRSIGLSTNNYDNCCFVQELYIENTLITDIGSTLIKQALRSIGPMLKRVEFVNCETTNNQVFKLISNSPSIYNASYVAISLSSILKPQFSLNPYYKYYYSSNQEKKAFTPTFKNISYLKIAPIPIFVNNHESVATLQHIAQIIRRSPNLCKLVLDAEIPIDYGIGIALKQSANLKNLTVISKKITKELRTVIPTDNYDYGISQCNNLSGDTLLTNTNIEHDNNYQLVTTTACTTPASINSTTTEKGLRTLIFQDSRGTKLRMHHNRCAGIFKKNHKTLEVLWIRSDLNRKLLTELGSCGGTNLREINLSMLIYGGRRHECYQSIRELFTKCPALEAITMNSREPGKVYCTTRVHSLPPCDSELMIIIAQHCPQLRHLSIISGDLIYPYPNPVDMDVFLETVEEFGIRSKLTYLEANLYWDKALDTVQQLKELKTLCLPIQTPDWPKRLKFPEDEIMQLRKVMSDRGGVIIYK